MGKGILNWNYPESPEHIISLSRQIQLPWFDGVTISEHTALYPEYVHQTPF